MSASPVFFRIRSGYKPSRRRRSWFVRRHSRVSRCSLWKRCRWSIPVLANARKSGSRGALHSQQRRSLLRRPR